MVMQSSGPISIGQAQAECRIAAGQVQASNADLSRLAGVSSGARYAWSYWYGKSSGFQIIDGSTSYYNRVYNGAQSINFVGHQFLQVSPPYTDPSTGDKKAVFSMVGGDNDTVGLIQPSPGPSGGLVHAFYRNGGYLGTVMIQNGSLDGCHWTSTWGEDYILTNDLSYTWDVNGNRYTSYAVYPTSYYQDAHVGVPYSYRITGTVNRPQPEPTPPDPGGGGDNPCCFVAGSLVLMADMTWQPIETLEPGDMLMGPSGPVAMKYLYISTLGSTRKLLTFADDPATVWSDEHPFWSRQGQDEWWWSANADHLKAEMESGLIAGLKNPDSVWRKSPGEIEFAHLSGFAKRSVKVIEGAHPDTPVMIPVLDGSPCIINGYVVGAFLNEENYDYRALRWQQCVPQLCGALPGLQEELGYEK
jgi:hypothetical protein